MLEIELRRFAEEMPPLGMLQLYLIGDLASGAVACDSELELVIVQDTELPFHRRADFWTTHLRPRVGTRFLVFTPKEFQELGTCDPVLADAMSHGEAIHGG